MPVPDPDLIERLLAEALAQFDAGGEAALAAFVGKHADHATALERGIRRCRAMGLLDSAPAPEPEQAPERLGEFRLLRKLGGGGMGVVHEAVQEPLGRKVALKVIRPELLFFEGARERFRREVDAIARLDHPAIVKVFAAGEHDGVPFFSMELLDGLDLERVCGALRGRDPAQLGGGDLQTLLGGGTGEVFVGSWWQVAVRIAHQVALGLAHAHLRGIVHRDLKPSNLVVTPHGRAVVLDFGVARVRAHRELTRAGSALGSPAFMSPEQRRGEATDERTDVFSLAATVWQLLTLRRPFRGEGDVRGVEPLPTLGDRRRAVPRELELVLHKALDPQRERRYGDMAAFAADLQAVLARRPIAARPLGFGLRLLRWSQRHRAAAAALAVASASTLVMLVVLLLVQRSSAAQLRAEQALTRASLDTSLEVLNSVLVQLGNERLRAVPQAEAEAHAALVIAAGHFRMLVQEHPGDEEVAWRAGRALHALALSHERRGEVDEAFAAGEEALAVVGAFVGDAATDVRAHARMSLGSWCVDRRDREGARRHLDLAEAEFARLAAVPARALEVQRSRAMLCTTRSLLVDERAHPDEVERYLREAVAYERTVVAVERPRDSDRALLTMGLGNLGKFLHRQQRDEEARPLLVEALAVARELPERGVWPPGPVHVAEALDALGSAQQALHETGAEQSLRDSIAARRQVVASFPGNAEFRVRLGGALHNLGRVLWADEARRDEARVLFDEAATLQRDVLARAPGHTMAVDFLAKHLEMIGFGQTLRQDAAALQATADELAALPCKLPHPALRAADFQLRVWLLAGKQDATRLDASMAALLLAEQRGLTAAQLPKRGFEALAERDDYQQWRARIEARSSGK